MVKYPPDFPQEAVSIIVKAWKNKDIKGNRSSVAEAAWNILGYGLGRTLGESEGPALMLMGDPSIALDATKYGSGEEINDEEMITHLEGWVNDSPEGKQRLGAFPIPKELIVKWAISFLIKLASGLV